MKNLGKASALGHLLRDGSLKPGAFLLEIILYDKLAVQVPPDPEEAGNGHEAAKHQLANCQRLAKTARTDTFDVSPSCFRTPTLGWTALDTVGAVLVDSVAVHDRPRGEPKLLDPA